MIVVIDAGNTRTKWGLFDESGKLLASGGVDNTQLDQLDTVRVSWSACRRAVVSNVAGAVVGERLESLFGRLQMPVMPVAATISACGVVNRYASPGQLGSDRWAALVAAWNLYREPCVVATAGTALTVDALSSSGEFLGGLIVPGWRLMQAALVSGTAGLPLQEGSLHEFPANTGDAIHSGIWLASAGAVERVCRSLQEKEGRTPRCILSGGDARQLGAALPIPVEIADNLVLHGLWLIGREHA